MIDNGMARTGSIKAIHADVLSYPNSSPFAEILDTCIFSKSLRDTRRVHARVVKTRFAAEVFIQNRFIDAYGKCGSPHDAGKMFERMAVKNDFSWNAMISALMKSGSVDDAVQVFGLMPQRDRCSWNSMLSGFSQHGFFEKALEYFIGMQRNCIPPDEFSLCSALSACTGLMNPKLSAQLHASAVKAMHDRSVHTWSALIDMHAKYGSVEAAQKIFNEMGCRNIVSWNSLISCYEQNGPACEALSVFRRMMRSSGHDPDEVTLASVVSACASLASLNEGRQAHARAVKRDRFRNDVILSNALVDMYSKCGRIKEARLIFDNIRFKSVISNTTMVSGYARAASVRAAESVFSKMAEKSVVSWNALISGYTQNGEDGESLKLFRLLRREGSVFPTHYTIGAVLNACANLSDARVGRQTHADALKRGFSSDTFVSNSLMDAYLKCGCIREGRAVFASMAERDRISWNVMIGGFAQNGNAVEALEMFKEMVAGGGETPDRVTTVGVLSACSHAGLVEEGVGFFKRMREEHGVVPDKEHYACVVDLLGRAGRLAEARQLIDDVMPMQADGAVWTSLLAACRVHGSVEMGNRVAGELMCTARCSGAYALVSNLCAEVGRWGDAVTVRKLMRHRRVTKQPGCSCSVD